MKKEVSNKRWLEAQEYEKKYWANLGRTSSTFYLNKANKIKKDLKEFILLNDLSTILQIGCGPQDAIHNWGKGNLFAIDPLIDYFKQIGMIKESNVKNICCVGENLPFMDDYFDLIIVNNVLDHCQNPSDILGQSYRCLKKDGIYIWKLMCSQYLLISFLN